MSIDKALYQAPVGIGALAGEPDATHDFEIEIVDPKGVKIKAGGLEIDMDPDVADDGEPAFDDNLVDFIDAGKLSSLVSSLESDIANDIRARADWEQTYVDGLKLLGLKYEERTEPWHGACGVTHPMITEAIVRFQSEMITETFPAQGPVLAKIIGKETPEKKAAAARVREDMNYQLTEKMVEFRAEHEKMLWSLPAAGAAFKKVYDDDNLGRQTSVFVPAEDIILPYGVSDARSSHRVTHRLRKTKNDILKLQQSGFYADVDIGEPSKTKDDIQSAKDEETGFSDINDERFVLYESHVELDIPGFEDVDDEGEPTGIALPYVLTMLRGTSTVLSVRRNWREEDTTKIRRQHFVQYNYIPGFGAYGFGLFHLIGGFAKSATSIMRQLVDAGTLSNLPGGLKSRGLRIKGDETPISPGEFRDVDVGAGSIRDNILPLPYKEPSNTLFQLLGSIVEEGRRFAATADMQVSDMSAQAPVGTTLALLERQLKVMTAVQARTHYSLKQELGLLKDIIRDSLTDDAQGYDYEPETGVASARRSDFAHVDICPVSDPNASTLSQRVVQYQAAIQLASSAPQIYDLPVLHRGMLDVLGIKDAAKMVPLPEDQKPQDPVTENMGVLKGKPVKAFMYQDHESHIRVHMAAMQDPVIMQVLGQNPQAQAMMATMNAHIAEHVGYAYRAKIEQQLGVAMPAEDAQLPPEVELALSSMMAKAANDVLQQNKTQQAAQQAQQAAQDPMVQIQMRELAVSEREVAVKEAEAKSKAQDRAGRLQLAQGQQQIESAGKADKQALEESRLQIESADKADKQALAERKQLADEEIAEQVNTIKAVQVGMMGRAQDQQVLIKDREMAGKLEERLAKQNETNRLGESGEQ